MSDIKCDCTRFGENPVCPLHNYYNYVIQRYHINNGDNYTVKSRYKCGCCTVYARNPNIYDGSDTFDYTCPQCKNYPKNLEKEKKRIKDLLEEKYNEEVKYLIETKNDLDIESEYYINICENIGSIRAKYDVLIEREYNKINIPKPDRTKII